MSTEKNLNETKEKSITEKMAEERKKFVENQPTDEEMKEIIIKHLKEIYDPELPVNIYDLGLVYNIDCWTDEVSMMKKAKITMTLTSATCSFSQVIIDLVKSIAARQEGLEEIEVEIVFDPPWGQDSMTDDAKLAMGLL
ncbi:iron-sulfur cluster assembly protein [Sulfurovum sp.]|uniref:metal-sulfur cluster assembly factor n=1 Tax=Sulfurovum sp. TaxID=1969726 RepID=UPI002867B079|nr:iron-sulfur cluster assembly protein [Sulfurovum sp.]